MEDYDKTESMEERDRSGIENSKDFGKDPTPPPMKQKINDEIQGEFKKINPPTFSREVKSRHEAKTQLLVMDLITSICIIIRAT